MLTFCYKGKSPTFFLFLVFFTSHPHHLPFSLHRSLPISQPYNFSILGTEKKWTGDEEFGADGVWHRPIFYDLSISTFLASLQQFV
jgi:hypothetical protein